MIKMDYFNRIRVFTTQVMPGMIADNRIPAKIQINHVMKAYDKFDTMYNFQASKTLKSYQGAYIKNLHLLIEKHFKEVNK